MRGWLHCFEGFDRRFLAAFACHQHDGQAGMFGHNRRDELQPRHAAHADVNAANNISGLASISLMSRLSTDPSYAEPGTSQRALAVGH